MSFNNLGLSEPLLRAVRASGYETPTPIQLLAIPKALAGCDLIGRAKTGSGKTAAFVLPILDLLSAQKRKQPTKDRRGPVPLRALVLAPTRELAQQTTEKARQYGRFTRLRFESVYGGVSMDAQTTRLRRGVDLAAATPGRLLDHIERGNIDLSACEILVVDEADRMFDMGFIEDVRRIIGKLPKHRQTLLFSATMNPEVRKLSGEIMRDPLLLETGSDRKPAESVRQRFIAVDKFLKMRTLAELLESNSLSSVLVFSRTRHGANKISRDLDRMGVSTAAIHSDRTQGQRERALRDFRSGSVRVLVATDIAARGIDVTGISHVINYDTPAFAEDYIHRIGRTGRADASGDAITFVSGDERAALRRIESFTGKRFELEGRGNSPSQPSAAPGKNIQTRSAHTRDSNPGRRQKNRSNSRVHGNSPKQPKTTFNSSRRYR